MATIGKKQWAGRISSGLVISFLIFDSVIKVLTLAPAIQATTQLGYPAVGCEELDVRLVAEP